MTGGERREKEMEDRVEERREDRVESGGGGGYRYGGKDRGR